jgi:hypothetical protein
MKEQEVFALIKEQCAAGYRVNEIIGFQYPYREIKVKALVNKEPEESVKDVYAVLIDCIATGMQSHSEIAIFLGLAEDDFLLQELFELKNQGLLEQISGNWSVTEKGSAFMKGQYTMRTIEEDEIAILLDGIMDKVLPWERQVQKTLSTENGLNSRSLLPRFSSELITNHKKEIEKVFDKMHQGSQGLVSIIENEITSDRSLLQSYYLIEYTPLDSKDDVRDPFLEVRYATESLDQDKRLTKLFNQDSKVYEYLLKELSYSERSSVSEEWLNRIAPTSIDDIVVNHDESNVPLVQNIGIWETQQAFLTAIETAQSKLWVESPWVKRAAHRYFSLIRKAVKRGVQVYICYGIDGQDEHDSDALGKFAKLSQENSLLRLIHIPTHMKANGNNEIVGTHRKLLIKDEELYISGSFNFLSFSKREGEKVSNEESCLVRCGVVEKWAAVFKEYALIP